MALTTAVCHDPVASGTDMQAGTVMNSADATPSTPASRGPRGAGAGPADEGSALRRVAALVAQATPPATVFAAVAQELGGLLAAADFAMVARYRPGPSVEVVGGWSRTGTPILTGRRGPLEGGAVSTLVFERGQQARVDEIVADGPLAVSALELGIRSAVGVPLRVSGRLWGLLIAASSRLAALPQDTETRMARFHDVVIPTIAHAQAREELQASVDEHAALRAVAMLVAQGEPPSTVFDAVAEQAGQLIEADLVLIGRRDGDSRVSGVAAWSRAGDPFISNSIELGGDNVTSQVVATGRPARIDDYLSASGAAAVDARSRGVASAVGVPVTVNGEVWGVLLVASTGSEPLAPTTEQTLLKFTDVAATAVANAQAREELRRVADEHAALRGIATLVAKAAAPDEIFTAVTAAAGATLDADSTALSRFDRNEAELMAAWTRSDASSAPVGSRARLGGHNLHTLLLETGRPARVDDYGAASGEAALYAAADGIRSAAGAPISVDGHLWGALTATSRGVALAADTETRLARFSDLVATAIANALAKGELAAYAKEQAALRRVASLVASTPSPTAVFAAVASEVGQLLECEFTLMNRYNETDATLIGAWGREGRPLPLPVGSPFQIDGRNVTSRVHQTSQPARVDEFGDDAGQGPAEFVAVGIRSAVGAPIVVEGRLWGVMIAMTERPLPVGTESRLADFTERVASDIGNAAAYEALTLSRARIVATVDQTRRRIERDLHDGTQQRLVSLALELGAARSLVPADEHVLANQLDDIATGLTDATAELRELARGIHPAVLSEGGLAPAVRALARRATVPVSLSVDLQDRLPEQIEVAAYYVVSEALNNTAKYANATGADVVVGRAHDRLHVHVSDDGRGGAQLAGGSGLLGLKDRVEALGGRLAIHSRPGQGTLIEASIPVAR